MARRRRRRGEGTVYRSDGSWIARLPLGTVNGKRVSRRVRCKTEREALQALEQLRRDYGHGNPATGTVGQYLAAWLTNHGRSVRKRTRESYEGHVNHHISPLLGGIPLARLQPADVRRLVGELERKKLAPASIHRVVTTLRIALNAAIRDRMLVHNAADIRELPRVERVPVRAMLQDEADLILDTVEPTWIGPIVRLLLGSGIRISEAIGLDQSDLLLDEGFIRVRHSKTDVRAVPITDDAVAALREALAAAPRIGPNEPVFYSPRHPTERMGRHSVSHALPRILEPVGLGHITPHALRHGVATLMLTSGHQMRVISEQLGHRNPALTARTYAHVVPQAQRAAVTSLERRRVR